jgi:hypothetical protein
MIRRISTLLWIIWLISSAAIEAGAQATQKADVGAQATQQAIQKEEPLVYAAVIDELFSGKNLSDKPIKALLLENRTRFDDFEGEAVINPKVAGTPLFTGVKPETMDSFIKQNAQRSQLTASIKASVKLQTVEDKLVQETIKGNLWKKLYAAYPDCAGIISLSKIGFDKEGKQALVYVAHVYGEDTGRGAILFLQKTGQQWKVQEKTFNWVWTG